MNSEILINGACYSLKEFYYLEENENESSSDSTVVFKNCMINWNFIDKFKKIFPNGVYELKFLSESVIL